MDTAVQERLESLTQRTIANVVDALLESGVVPEGVVEAAFAGLFCMDKSWRLSDELLRRSDKNTLLRVLESILASEIINWQTVEVALEQNRFKGWTRDCASLSIALARTHTDLLSIIYGWCGPCLLKGGGCNNVNEAGA